MPSGAGRTPTRRDAAARRRRSTSAAWSRSAQTRWAARDRPWSPSVVRHPDSRRSASSRSAAARHAVSRTTIVARHSLICPAVRAAIVHGSSWTSARATPTCRSACPGETRRASATSDRAARRCSDACRSDSSSRATAADTSPSRCSTKRSVARACRADAAPLVDSRRATTSRSSASPRPSTDAAPRAASDAASASGKRASLLASHSPLPRTVVSVIAPPLAPIIIEHLFDRFTRAGQEMSRCNRPRPKHPLRQHQPVTHHRQRT